MKAIRKMQAVLNRTDSDYYSDLPLSAFREGQRVKYVTWDRNHYGTIEKKGESLLFVVWDSRPHQNEPVPPGNLFPVKPRNKGRKTS